MQRAVLTCVHVCGHIHTINKNVVRYFVQENNETVLRLVQMRAVAVRLDPGCLKDPAERQRLFLHPYKAKM